MRREDWQRKFNEAVATASLVDFRYGQHDCVTFVAYVVDRMCDTNYVKKLREAYGYADELSALSVIESHGGLLNMVTDWLGPPVHRAMAMPGDVVLLRNEGRVLLGIVEGHQALAAAERGVVALPLFDAVVAWRIK